LAEYFDGWYADMVGSAVKVSHLHSNLSASRRTHDLRHGAATMALAAGVDIEIVQEQLGHCTSTLTRDTYTSVVKQLHRTGE